MPTLMTISQFQNKYNLSRSTFYRLRHRGAIRVVRVGRSVRIPTEDADNWYKSLRDEDDGA